MDLIIPESYLFCCVILFKLQNQKNKLNKWQFIKKLLLQSRIDDIKYSRDIMIQMQRVRGDKLYLVIPSDFRIANYLYENELITKDEWKLIYSQNINLQS